MASIRNKEKQSNLEDTSNKENKVACCLICDKYLPIDKLTKPSNIQSWKTIVAAATIRKHKKVLEHAQVDGIPNIYYETSCRNTFIHKKALNRLKAEKKTSKTTKSYSVRNLLRTRSNKVQTCDKCLFCNKVSKYFKHVKSRETLLSSADIRTNKSLKAIATHQSSKEASTQTKRKTNDRILTVMTQRNIDHEVNYHRSCYLKYMKQGQTKSDIENKKKDPEETNYAKLESLAYNHLINFINEELIPNPELVTLKDLAEVVTKHMTENGINQLHMSTKKNLKRRIESEFGSRLKIISEDYNKPLIAPFTLTYEQLAKQYINLKEKFELYKSEDCSQIISKAAIILHNHIKEIKQIRLWPPCPDELDEQYVDIPKQLTNFLTILLTGKNSHELKLTPKIDKLIWSFSQDLICGVTSGRVQTSKHILIPWAIKTLTGNVELIKILNRLGHGISYSKLEEIDKALET